MGQSCLVPASIYGGLPVCLAYWGPLAYSFPLSIYHKKKAPYTDGAITVELSGSLEGVVAGEEAGDVEAGGFGFDPGSIDVLLAALLAGYGAEGVLG